MGEPAIHIDVQDIPTDNVLEEIQEPAVPEIFSTVNTTDTQ